MFPIINHINDLLPFIKDNPQFRVAEQPNGTTIVCYMLQDEDTFRGQHEVWYKECRGITFDTATGRVVSRTLHKFQNVGGNEATQVENIPWNSIIRIMDKRDGSMITPVLMSDGSIVCKTKKTFDSAEAIAATEFLNADPLKLYFVRNLLQKGYTPSFEWTSPRFPIVLMYDKDELTLLQIRHNVTGQYETNLSHETLHSPFPIIDNIVDEYRDNNGVVSWEKLHNMALNRTGIEGVIIQTVHGEMWKVKTKWYCDLHHSVTFTRWRDVARTVAEDKSDDLKAAFTMTGRSIEPILKVEREMARTINIAQTAAESHAGNGLTLGRTAKEMAAALKDNPLFNQIMRLFRGGQVDWLEWYAKHHVDSWGLEVIPTELDDPLIVVMALYTLHGKVCAEFVNIVLTDEVNHLMTENGKFNYLLEKAQSAVSVKHGWDTEHITKFSMEIL